jgi:hypothetical protein
MADPWSPFLDPPDPATQVRVRVVATFDKTLRDLIAREKTRAEPVLDVATLEHVRRLLRLQGALLSWVEAREHNALVAEEALAEPAEPDSREKLQAMIDARSASREVGE